MTLVVNVTWSVLASSTLRQPTALRLVGDEAAWGGGEASSTLGNCDMVEEMGIPAVCTGQEEADDRPETGD